jgi:hypothetical protein
MREATVWPISWPDGPSARDRQQARLRGALSRPREDDEATDGESDNHASA